MTSEHFCAPSSSASLQEILPSHHGNEGVNLFLRKNDNLLAKGKKAINFIY